jgi:hypothetical protein
VNQRTSRAGFDICHQKACHIYIYREYIYRCKELPQAREQASTSSANKQLGFSQKEREKGFMAGGARDGSEDDAETTTTNEGRRSSDHAAGATTNYSEHKQLVPFLDMLKYADRTDAALMAVGTVAAVANGMTEPLMTVVFAAVIECFGAGDDATILHRVSKVR